MTNSFTTPLKRNVRVKMLVGVMILILTSELIQSHPHLIITRKIIMRLDLARLVIEVIIIIS
jgi:hypothetical protein